MPLSPHTLHLIVRATVNSRVELRRAAKLLRYLPDAGGLPTALSITNVYRMHDGDLIQLDAGWWSLDDVGPDGDNRLLRLTFEGANFINQLNLNQCGPDRELYDAFLNGDSLHIEVLVQTGNCGTKMPLIVTLGYA